jgi:hypothetical protein
MLRWAQSVDLVQKIEESTNILWRIDPVLSGDSVNNDRFWATATELLLETGYYLCGPCRNIINRGQSIHFSLIPCGKL